MFTRIAIAQPRSTALILLAAFVSWLSSDTIFATPLERQSDYEKSQAREVVADRMDAFSVVIVKNVGKSELETIVLDFLSRHKRLSFEIAQLKVEQHNDSTIWLLFPFEVRLNTVLRLLAHVNKSAGSDPAAPSIVALSRIPILGLPIGKIAIAFFVLDRGAEDPLMIAVTSSGIMYRFMMIDEPNPVEWNGRIPCEILSILRDAVQFQTKTKCMTAIDPD